jgi:hypothetical protein
MTGPYTAHIYLNIRPADATGEPDFSLTWEEDRADLAGGDEIASRYYRSGGGATMLGTIRAATFAIGATLLPGESAYIRLRGRIATGPYASEDAATGEDTIIRRDEAGRLLTTLGSRWGRERHFIGL